MIFQYDTFEPGKIYGTDRFVVDQDRMTKWLAMYPGDENGDLMPPGMVSMIQIQAYMNIITPRPPGNVHGSQIFKMHKLPRIGMELQTEVQCLSKEIRKERKWVRTGYTSRGPDGTVLFTGIMTTLQAA